MKRLDDRYRGPALWSFLLTAVVLSVWATGFTPEKMQTWGNAVEFVRGMFPPRWSVLPDVLKAMGITVAMAFLGTFLAFVLAFPISFVTARNIGPKWLGAGLRTVMAFLRSVPEVLWALLFVLATEAGPVAGVLALVGHNVGILSKLIGEVYEEAPIGPQEAMLSTGAGRATAIWYGILPWAMPTVLSHTFFRLECNIRSATILGIVGAGGIGKELMVHRALFDYPAMFVDTLGILVLVVFADWIGAAVRKQVT